VRISVLRTEGGLRSSLSCFCASRQAGGARRVGEIGRPYASLRAALRCSGSWPRRLTRFSHFVGFAQTGAASQSLKRAARAGQDPSSPRRAQSPTRRAPPACRSTTGLVRRANAVTPLLRSPKTVAAKVGSGGRAEARVWTPRSAGFLAGARSALQALTRATCPSVTNEVSEASYGVRPRIRAAQGSLSEAKGRPIHPTQPARPSPPLPRQS